MNFGFTNNDADMQAARDWVAAAVADGWSVEPTYKSESVERAASLWKNGWHALVLMRDNSNTGRKWKYEAQVSVWSPDGISVNTPHEYNWAKLEDGQRMCQECGTRDVKTVRVGFAGRCCEACLPAAREKYEYPGWCN